MRIWPICVALLLWPALASAGAWPREKGTAFLSFSYMIAAPYDALGVSGSDLDQYANVYLEVGMTPRLTFGVDGGMDPGGSYTVIAFLRRPIDLGGDKNVYAMQAGIGAEYAEGGPQYLVQSGLSWGRGLQTRFGSGWAGLDATVTYNTVQRNYVPKANLTLGLNANDRTKLMLQVQAGAYPGSDPYLRLAPSVVRKMSKRTYLEFGAQLGLAGDERVGVKLGTWLEF